MTDCRHVGCHRAARSGFAYCDSHTNALVFAAFARTTRAGAEVTPYPPTASLPRPLLRSPEYVGRSVEDSATGVRATG